MSNCTDSFLGLLNCNSGIAADQDNTTIGSLVAALAFSFASLGVQVLAFVILRLRLYRIYRPRSYLVAERERVPPPPGGLIGWLYPLFTTPNVTIIQKCGLDAYFYLRFLRMLFKIFFPLAIILIPILFPINATAGGGYTSLDKLSISNVIASKNAHTVSSRLWAHLILGVCSIIWILWVVTDELKRYIRVRQAFLASPQHRIRASATTVLVTGVPRKWLTHAALSGLFDVFPGGIRNIWINRNYDELAAKVKERDKAAKSLEKAETKLIKLCREKHEKVEKKRLKKAGAKSRTKEQKKQDEKNEDTAAEQLAQGEGVSAGAQRHSRFEVEEIAGTGEKHHHLQTGIKHPWATMGKGLGVFGKGVSKAGGKVAGNFDSNIKKTNDGIVHFSEAANDAPPLAGGFALDDSLYTTSPTNTERSPATSKANALRLEVPHGDDSHDEDATPVGTSPLNANVAASTHHAAQTSDHAHEALPGSAGSEQTLNRTLSFQSTDLEERRPKSPMQIEEPDAPSGFRKWLMFFNDDDRSIVLPSPLPQETEEEEFPFASQSERPTSRISNKNVSKSKFLEALQIWKQKGKVEGEKYPNPVNGELDEDQGEDPKWRQYIEPKDRETTHLPLFSASWFPSLPLVGKKVDRIYRLRRELARLNLEIEFDQANPEKYPLMNSAFIQFNHQVAAHMCCQSLSHHLPQQMAPRLVEISPDDVIWDNMSVKWWERYFRYGIASVLCIAVIFFYTIPVAFTGLLSNISNLTNLIPWLDWLDRAPSEVLDIIQGVAPGLLLSVIVSIVPKLYNVFVRQSGVPTGSAKAQGVQAWYFTFLFIQVFFVASISNGLTSFFSSLVENPTSVVKTLATDLPKAADYFFSYLTIQALSNTSGALLQVITLVVWFFIAPLLDSTARAKWRRQTKLKSIEWGEFFPVITNFATIGIIYSLLAPLILVFMLLICGLYYIVYGYNILYVNQFRQDSGGLLFPAALNQLFVGLYFLEVCLIGIFFTSTVNGEIVCIGQGVIMIVVLVSTIAYQVGMNVAFKPLYRYLPITLEDEAVIRDEEFARAEASKFGLLTEVDERDECPPDVLSRGEGPSVLQNKSTDEPNAQAAEDNEKALARASPDAKAAQPPNEPRRSRAWHHHSDSRLGFTSDNLRKVGPEAVARLRYLADGKPIKQGDGKGDAEAQQTVGDVLYSGFADELEDMTPEDRDLLVRYAFQHSALRARRPVVWIPRDKLGVSDDEVQRAQRMSTVGIDTEDGERQEKTYIWMSNEGTALDHKGRVVFRRSPPDFSAVDLVLL